MLKRGLTWRSPVLVTKRWPPAPQSLITTHLSFHLFFLPCPSFSTVCSFQAVPRGAGKRQGAVDGRELVSVLELSLPRLPAPPSDCDCPRLSASVCVCVRAHLMHVVCVYLRLCLRRAGCASVSACVRVYTPAPAVTTVCPGAERAHTPFMADTAEPLGPDSSHPLPRPRPSQPLTSMLLW